MRRRKSGERGASTSSDPRQEKKMTKPLSREDVIAVKYEDSRKEYPKQLELKTTVGHLKDLLLQEMMLNNWITDDEEVVHFVFGKIAPMWENAKSLNGYLNLEIPFTITLNKQEQKKSEVKFRTYE